MRNTDNNSFFNILPRPFIHRKKEFSDTFYKCDPGTKTNNILKRTGTGKQIVKVEM